MLLLMLVALAADAYHKKNCSELPLHSATSWRLSPQRDIEWGDVVFQAGSNVTVATILQSVQAAWQQREIGHDSGDSAVNSPLEVLHGFVGDPADDGTFPDQFLASGIHDVNI